MLIYKSDDFNKENIKKFVWRKKIKFAPLGRFFRDGEKPTFT